MAFAWVVLALLYLVGLFGIARWGDKNSPAARWLTSHPFTYALALAIFCTAWTFFGAVGEASRDSWNYLPILLGPMLLYLFGYRFLFKLNLVSKKQHINTIADFIASRYGKRQTVALLVTIIALLATIPYIALQLKAIGSAFQLISGQPQSQAIIVMATLFIAMFSIYFGTQHTDVTEYRRGLILAIAFESSIKLIALLLVATVAYLLWDSSHKQQLLTPFTTPESLAVFTSVPFWTQTLMAAIAVICLPRQFHIGVVDNLKLEHLKTARWLFPLYLLVTASVIPVIASIGQTTFADSTIGSDNYVLGLAILSDSLLLQMLVFIGGLSAATAMIIVATLTLSTMLTNDVILPKLLSHSGRQSRNANYGRRILLIRRLSIGLLLLLAFTYQQQMTGSRSLASIGLVAFSLVIQLMPAVLGGLYWKRGHAHGVYAGLLTGLFVWILWLVLPILGQDYPTQKANDIVSQAALLSLLANGLAYVFFSYLAPTRLIDRIQAEAFVCPSDLRANPTKKAIADVTISDMLTLLATFMGEKRCQQLVSEYKQHHHIEVPAEAVPDARFLAFCERALGGVIGASSAKALIDSLIQGKKLDFAEVVNFFDDTTQAMQFNMAALLTSLENIDQGISVIDKHLNLVAWNKRYVALFNYPQDMISIGTPIESLVRYNAVRGECGPGPTELHVQKRMEHLKSGTPHRFTRQRGDGRVIEMVGNPLPGGGFVTSFNDITEHMEIQQALEESNIDLENRIKKRTEEVHAINAELRLEIQRRSEAEKELIRARKTAEQANASKTRFLALASHDILQPLNAAKLYLSALEEANVSDSVQGILHKLSDSVTSSETLIAVLLDIARLDQGEMQPHIEPVQISTLLAPLLDEFRMKAKEKGLAFNAIIGEHWLLADRIFTYRIVQNLLSNAVKYTEHGKILLTARRQAEHILIQIRDTGIGIPEELQGEIFHDFYRAEQQNEHGFGLGLGVVSRLATQMDCPIAVKSKVATGSCFSIRLPRTAPQQDKHNKKCPRMTPFRGIRVLCVDDQQENLDAMQTLLDKWQVEVSLARNWQQALEQASQQHPHILLVDYQLGNEANGLSLINKIRHQQEEYIPASLVTANQDKALVKLCQQQDIHYLNKPIKPHKLRALLQSMKTKLHSKTNYPPPPCSPITRQP